MDAEMVCSVVAATTGSRVRAALLAHDALDLDSLELMRITAQPVEPEDVFEAALWRAWREDNAELQRAKAERDRQESAERAHAAAARAREALAYANVPDCTFANWRRPAGDRIDVAERVRVWVDGGWREKPVLCLAGPYGRGKSHLAVAALRRMAQAGGTFQIGTLEDLLSSTDPRLAGDTCRAAMRAWQSASIAVIDEFPATSQTISERQSARVYEVVDARIRAGCPVVITTNRVAWLGTPSAPGVLDAVETETRGKLVSRMRGHGLMLRFRDEWPDYRMNGGGR